MMMMDHLTQIGGMHMDSSEMEREWKRLSQRSNDLEFDIGVLESRLMYRDTLEKQLTEKYTEYHAVTAKLRKLGVRMNQ